MLAHSLCVTDRGHCINMMPKSERKHEAQSIIFSDDDIIEMDPDSQAGKGA